MKKEFLGQLVSAFDKEIDMRVVFMVSSLDEQRNVFKASNIQFGDELDKVITSESSEQRSSSVEDVRLATTEETASWESAAKMTIEQYQQKAIAEALGIDLGSEQ